MADLRGKEIRETYKYILSLEATTSSRATGNNSAIDVSAKFVTDGTGARTSLRLGTSTVGIGGVNPTLEFTNTNPLTPNPVSANRAEFFRTTDEFGFRFIRTPENNSIISANSYHITYNNVTGEISTHFFQVSGILAARIDGAGVSALTSQTIMTLEKTDSRYIKITNNTFAGSNTFTGPVTFEETVTFNGFIRENFQQVTATGSTQLTAAPIINSIVDIIIGTDSTGLLMPVCQTGLKIVIINSTNTNKLIYPQPGNNIKPLASDVPLTLGPDATVTFYGRNSITWVPLYSFYG